MKSVCIIGTGQAARAMGRLLARAGYAIAAVVSRSTDRARDAARFIGVGTPSTRTAAADLVLLAVPDDRIEEVAEGLGDVRGSVVAHLSGARSSEILAAPRARGARTGAIHPLRSFADPAGAAESFPGTFCAVEGEAAAELETVVRAIGGVPLRVRTEGKALYHAGAVFASNYLVAILEAALRLFEAAGVPRTEALPALAVLARGTVENVSRIGIPAALSGPIERGDAATVARHAAAIRERLPALAGLYSDLGRLSCEVALAKGSIGKKEAGALNGAFGSPESPGVVLLRPERTRSRRRTK
ncbi:MAG: DUF2520 domain-containing protein [Planctomycetes bacterium]|nr:DUF2520 domain-containing protein [Planctomycetota bacterium]